jgi:hypothetical protein
LPWAWEKILGEAEKEYQELLSREGIIRAIEGLLEKAKSQP